MKRIIALAGAFALAACSGGDADAPAEAEAPDAAEAPASEAPLPTANAGTYTSLAQDGSEVVVSLGADGNYAVSEGGAEVEAGTWETNANGTCLTPAAGGGENCYAIEPGTEAGTMVITDADGEAITYTFES